MTRNASTLRNSSFRNKVLVGAIAAALAIGTAGTAVAQSADYTLNSGPWSQVLALNNYLHSVNNSQTLAADASATLDNLDSIGITYAGSGAAQTASSNMLSALAVGNNATGAGNALDPNNNAGNSIAMGLLAADGGGNSGLGILSGQLNSDNTVNASVTGGTVSIALTGYNAGAATENGNSIRADTRMNDASSTISGHLPTATFAGQVDGSASITFPDAPAVGTLSNGGDITIGNAQTNADTAGSGAGVSAAGITITDTGSTNSTATFSNSGNAIVGSYIGNRGANSVNATGADGAPSYNGSVVVSSGQANLNAPASTTVDTSPITTTVAGSLRGSITQSGDNIDASTQGNTASNAITFASGISIDGNATDTTLLLGFGNNSTTASAGGDLVLLNGQGNQAGSDFSSAITGSGIVAETGAVSIAGASVTVHDDHMLASVGGNNADNSISADGASFAAHVAAGNQQANNGIDIGASVSGAAVGAYMDTTTNSLGSVSVDANSVGAGAQGNQATTNVSLAGTSFNSGSGTASGGMQGDAGTPSLDANADNAGVNVNNLQGNYDSASSITATNTGSLLGAYYTGGISGGSSTVGSNSIGASAGGNAATTNVALSGGNATFSAALTNTQYNENAISGSVSDAILGIYVDSGAVGNATLTTNGNSFGASAYGNQGSNSLSSDFTNATLGDSAAFDFGGGPFFGLSSFIALDPVTPINFAQGGMILTSSQFANGHPVDASVGDSQLGVDVAAGNTTNTPVTINTNRSNATAMANQVDNTLSPGVGNLSTGDGFASQIATLGNLQVATDNAVSASNTLDGGTGLLAIGAQFGGSLSGSPVTVSDNGISAVAAGNVAGNTLAFSGANYAPDALTTTTPNGLALQIPDFIGFGSGSGLLVANSAAFALQNVQGSSGGSRQAEVSANGLVGILALGGGTISDSPLTINGNNISAAARDNSAGNNLSLSGFSTLTTTASLQSSQVSDASVGSSVSGGIGLISLGNVSGSALTDSNNSIAASSVANVANNQLAIQAGQLGGDGLDHQLGDALNGTLGTPSGTLSGALGVGVAGTGSFGGTLADYGLANTQLRIDGAGTVTASVTRPGISLTVLGSTLNGGSATVSGNSTTALAQDNSASNILGMDVTSTAATAAASNLQYVGEGNDANASVTSLDNSLGTPSSFAIQVGGNIGNSAALPLTVSGNTQVAQAGLNDAVNSLHVTGTSSIDASNNIVFGAGNADLVDVFGPAVVNAAVADFAVSSNQVALSSATALLTPGLTGIESGGNIGRNGQTSALTVNANKFVAQAAANSAANSVILDGASSISASTAVSNYQLAAGEEVTATTTGASVGVYTDNVGTIRNANTTVSDNSLNASASGNSASNTINVQPVALNAGNASFFPGSTGSVAGVINVGGDLPVAAATANNSLANQQENFTAINATVSASNIGVNSGTPGASSSLLTSTATVGGNSAAASASGNSASNSIMLASLPSGVSSSALVSNQVNDASISATVSAVNIGVNAGATSSTPVTVSNNNISATAVGNSATNHIGISN